jgi:hypothetical protein
MDDLSRGEKNTLPASLLGSPAEVNITKKHLESLIQKPDFLEKRPPQQETGAHGLIHGAKLAVIEIAHPPASENPASGKSTSQSSELPEYEGIGGKLPA